MSLVVELIQMLEASWLAGVLRSQAWVWPTLEIGHLYGLALLFGALIIVDLKVLGFAPMLPFDAAQRLIPFALAGFVLSAVTGSLLVLGDPKHFLLNAAFWTKMTVIGFAGCNAVFFNIHMRSGLGLPADGFRTSARVSAGLSLLLWAGVVTLARFIAFVEPYHD